MEQGSNANLEQAILSVALATQDLSTPTLIKNLPSKAIGVSTTPATQQMETGWDFITGNATNFVNKTITFPRAFTSVSNVVVGALGVLVGSDPTTISSFNTGFSGNNVMLHAYDITPTGFTLRGTLDSSATLATNVRVGFSWIAFGT